MPSSVIRAFAYDADHRRLAVTFQTGRRYAYCDVPAEVVEEFRRAFSKGEYFNAAIRDHYTFERVR
jgi:lysyl-tRNA synthetase class 2